MLQSFHLAAIVSPCNISIQDLLGTSEIANHDLELNESVEVEEVSTIIIEAEVSKPNGAIHVDLSVEVLDLDEQEIVEETCASSDAGSTVEVLENSIDEVVIYESSPASAKAVEDKKDISKDGADEPTLKKGKSVEKENLLEEGLEVMSIEMNPTPSSAKKIREKSGILLPGVYIYFNV